MSSLKFSIYNSFTECKSIISDFNQQSNINNYFFGFDWLEVWWNFFGKGKKLYIIIMRESDKVIGIAPFYCMDKSYLSIQEFGLLGDSYFSYLDIFCLKGYEELFLSALFDHWRSIPSAIIVHFKDINDRFSRFFQPLQNMVKQVKHSQVYKLYPCPLASIGDDWETFFKKQRNRKSRYNLQRYEKLLNKYGKLQFREIKSANELPKIFPQLEHIHQERFSDTENPLLKGTYRIFLYKILEKFINQRLSLTVTELDGIVISFLIGFKLHDMFIDFAPAFDPAFNSLSLGNVHLMRLMEKTTKEGCKFFDFSKGDADYKRWWSNDETTNYLFRFAFNPHGVCLMYTCMLDFYQQVLLKMRAEGYNVKIKKFIAQLRQGNVFGKKPDKVEIEEISSLSSQIKEKMLPWSYQYIYSFPIEVRQAIIKRLVNINSNDIKIFCDEISQLIYISLDNNIIKINY